MTAPAIEDLLRELTPQVLAALVRRYGQFEGCEDAVQEAVLAATVQWPAGEVPDNPRGWLVAVADSRSRRAWSLRIWSMSRRDATATSQPRGLSGTPSAVH